MTIPASAQPTPIVSPNSGLQFTDERGNLTNNARIALQQMHDYVVNMSRIIPCNVVTTANTIALTLLPVQPQLNQYSDYETFAFVADATSDGNLSANVTTANGTLTTLKVFKSNGATRAGSGDITSGLQYFLTYVDSLDTSAGGFVIR